MDIVEEHLFHSSRRLYPRACAGLMRNLNSNIEMCFSGFCFANLMHIFQTIWKFDGQSIKQITCLDFFSRSFYQVSFTQNKIKLRCQFRKVECKVKNNSVQRRFQKETFFVKIVTFSHKYFHIKTASWMFGRLQIASKYDFTDDIRSMRY